MNYKQRHVIKDPIYGSMSADSAEHELLRPFIDHPLMQRLRHIKQLSFVDLIFPGAVHTRFNHSLGVSYLCGKIYKQLYPASQSKGKLDYEHKLVILAGLLHDIGHGPFSHVFEQLQIFSNSGLEDDKITHDPVKHEDWFKFFINEMFEDPEIKRIAVRRMRDDLIAIFDGKSKKYAVIKNIFSSQLDADRMDYILRDSHFCGVQYGVYDLEWLLSCIGLNGNDIVITLKGVGSAEQFLHARSLMHQNVYYNVKSSAIAKCVIDLLEHLIMEPNLVKNISSEHLYNFLNTIKNYKDKSLKKSTKKQNRDALMSKLFESYKHLTDYDIWLAIRELASNKNGNTICHTLARNLYKRELPKAYIIEPSAAYHVKKVISDFKRKNKLGNWELDVVTKPVTFYQERDNQIIVLDRSGITRPLHDVSQTISRISNQTDQVCFLYVRNDLEKDKRVSGIIKECNKQAMLIYVPEGK